MTLGKRFIKRRKYCYILLYFFIFDVISIILLPNITLNVRNDEKLIEDPKSLIYTSSIGPPNKHFFQYYKTITINHNQVNGTGDHKNFPVLISLLDSDLKDHVNQSNGNDIAFANETAWLDHEIELFDQTYNSTHAKLIAWVRIPNLHTTKLTEIDIYYGNSTMGSQENPENVWDPNFKGVWHLSEDPSDPSPQMKDSTSNYNHGTISNLNTSDQVNGQIDGSIDFDNVQDHINCTDDSSLNVGSGEFSLSLWFNYDGGQWGWLAAKGAYIGGIRYSIQITVLNKLNGEIDDGTEKKNIQTTSNFDDNTWHHVVLVRDENYLLLYIDGDEYALYPIPGYGSLDNPQPFYMNTITGSPGGSPNGWSTSKLDEVRVSNTARSADWIATEYNNQYDPSSFYSISKQYKVIKHPVKAQYFRYYKEITIDHAMVNSSTDLLNFSILISIFDSDLRDHVYSSTGNDIAFAFNVMWLDHEIELFDQTYNGTHAQLISWVRIPILSTSLDTIIYMYYGNSTMGSRENPEGVWDNNYKGVWHLSELSGGIDSIKDSTLNRNNGTDYGTPSFEATGEMDGAIDLKGDIEDEYIEIPNSPSLTNITEGSYYTYEAWFYPDQVPPGIPNDHNNRRYGIMIKKDPHHGLYYDHDQYFAMEHWLDVGGTPTAKKVLSGTYIPGEFYHLVVVVSNIDGYMKLYVNGNLENETTWASGTDAWDYGTKFLRFGIANPGASIYRWPTDGKIDEIRVSNTFRSGGWIKTEYNNQFNPQAFMTLGLEEELNIIDDTPPTYSDLTESSDPLRVGQNVTISIKVYDFPGSGVNQVLLEYDSSNHTMVFIGGDTWSWNKWKPSIGIHFYKIFMEDMANNWNMTSGTITVVDATAPIIENITKSEDPIELGNNVTISVDVFDNETSVSTVFIELEAKNYTMVNVNEDTYEYNWTSSHAGIAYYTIYAFDSVNNWGFINDSILVQDTTLPFYSNLFESADPLELGDSLIIRVDIYDFAGINQTFIEIEGVNYSMTNDGNTWEYNSWTPNNWIVYQYKIHTEDNNGNWNSLITNITIQDTTPPSQPLLAS
ncbi:MAG: DUF2341 domain-containing protein, partial [Promethearchaeota archaeon]